MKTSAISLLLLFNVFLGSSWADIPPVTPKKDDGSIQAKVVAVNRGFGFIIVDAGSKKGVVAGMNVAILRDKKWVSGILKIGEITENETVLEYVKGKSDVRDRIQQVLFQKAEKTGKPSSFPR